MSSGNVRPVMAEQYYNHSPTKVFDAWVTPAIMRQWLFASPSNEIHDIELNLTIGGRFSIPERTAEGDNIHHFGEYLEIDRPRRLTFTLEVPKHFPGVTYVAIDIVKIKKGCELSLLQTGVRPETTEANWREMLLQLDKVLDGTNSFPRKSKI